jgi:methylphosphotriester-DNA--protein-cysteine methyltransferase
LSDEQRTPVREACARLGLNHARMIRLFRRLTGLPPKALANVQRFQRGLALLAHGGIAHGDIALRLGYYDQAHFNREFLRFAGAAPGEFVRRRGEDNESLVDAWIDSAPSSSPETQAHQCGCLSLPTMRASM